MIYQQSLSDIESVFQLWTPLQLVQQILRTKHEQDRMNNLYYKDYLKHFQPDPAGPTSDQLRSKDILSFSQTQQHLMCYNSMQYILANIKDTVMSRAQSQKYYPKFSNPILNSLTVRRNRRSFQPVLSNKKLSIHTASTRKSEDKREFKKITTVSVKPCEYSGKKRCGSSESILSKINHDLSQMIQDACPPATKQKNFSLKFHKNASNKQKNMNSKEKHFKRKLMQEKISEIKLHEDVRLYLGKDQQIDQNYGLSTIKNKVSSSRERKKYRFKGIKNEQKSEKKKMSTQRSLKSKKSVQQIFQFRSVERGALSPMTPKPRLLHQFTKQTGWKDYSINYQREFRNSYSKAPKNISKSRSKETSKVSSKKGLLSPRNHSKIKIKEKEKQKCKNKASKKKI